MPGWKEGIKHCLPKRLRGMISGLFYGWKGNYESWETAMRRCSGYGTETILEKVREASLKVKSGDAAFERDSVLFDEIQYSFPLLSGLLWAAQIHKGKLHVLDFGGSLGTSYYQNKAFLSALDELTWSVVEQPAYVACGRNEFEDDQLRFFHSVEECLAYRSVNTVLISSALQYLERPYDLLGALINHQFEIVIIDRIPFIRGEDRLTIQKVSPRIYKASYPCWFFDKNKMLHYMESGYELVLEFDALDVANIPSEFKGLIFKRK